MMQWALLGIFIAFLFFAFMIIQGTRAALAWRKAAAAGDVGVIRAIVDETLATWKSMKRPKNVPVETWRGVQSAQFVECAADFVRVSCTAQSEYRMYEGRWIEVRNPLQEGKAVAASIAEMLFYELPHYRPDRVQIDVYASFREGEGLTTNECILSIETSRDLARATDWDEWTSEEIVDHLGARYRLGERGHPLPIEVAPPADAEDPVTQAGAA